MNHNLLDKLLNSGSIKHAMTIADSTFFGVKEHVDTGIPIINAAFSGDLAGGFVTGLTIFAGASKSFKTLLALCCLKAYLTKYKDAVCLFYDSEFGTPPAYLKALGIDVTRVIHIPMEHIEQLKFDIVKRLETITKQDRVFIMVDSIGNLASKKEVEDAVEEKSVADMTRAKAIRSLLRIITPHLTIKNIPCIMINHVYQSLDLYSKTVIPGGTAVMYAANQVFVITKAQDKTADGTLKGYFYTITIEKSRFVREKAKFIFHVTYEDGIDRWSGLFDLALAGGYVIKGTKKGFYQVSDPTTGEVFGEEMRESKFISNDKFWEDLVDTAGFQEYVKKKYALEMGTTMLSSGAVEEADVAEEVEE